MNEVSRPPVRMKSSTRRPISLSASDVTIAARWPNARRRPRATLYSPPPSQARKDLAVRMRPSPGSRRSITSPRDTASKRHADAGRMLRSAIVKLLRLVSRSVVVRRGSAFGEGEGDGVGRQRPDTGKVAGLDAIARNHPGTPDRGDRRNGQVLSQVPRTDSAGGHKLDAAERCSDRSDRGRPTGGPGREELDSAHAELERGLDLGRRDGTGKGEHAVLVAALDDCAGQARRLSLIHISEPTRPYS